MAQCYRCKSEILDGQAVFIGNRPAPRTPFHADKAICATNGWSATKADSATSSAASAAPGSIDALIDARIDARLEGFEPSAALTEDDVKRIAAEVAGVVPVFKLERRDGTQVECKGEHHLFARLCKLVDAGIHVYLWGPAGSGKTTAALHAAEKLGIGGEIDTLDPSTPKSSVLGYRTPNGDPVWTAFLRQYGNGGAYIADENDNAPASVQTLLNSALANGHAPAAWGLIKRHDKFAFIGTGNTPGRPTPAFPDRKPMSAAFADRLYFMFWPIDENLERSKVGLPLKPTPKRNERQIEAAAWVEWVLKVREWAAKSAPTLQITPRASHTGLLALSIGETPDEVADGLVFRGADSALREKALTACPLP